MNTTPTWFDPARLGDTDTTVLGNAPKITEIPASIKLAAAYLRISETAAQAVFAEPTEEELDNERRLARLKRRAEERAEEQLEAQRRNTAIEAAVACGLYDRK